jgi:PAS domain S-box-containing protein
LSLAAVAITVCARLLLSDEMGDLPFALFVLPVLFAAWHGGLGGGLLATFVSAAAGWYLFVSPEYVLLKGTSTDFVRIALFAGIGISISVVASRLLRSLTEARRIETRFESTFENAAVGMSHVATNGRFLRANQRLCEITGYSRDELLQMTFGDITHPDDLEPDWALARSLLSGERARYSMEKRYRRKDGIMVWVNLTVSLLRDDAGAPEHFISVVEDITARRRAEEGMRQQARMLDLSHEPILARELNGIITFWNRGAEMLYGWSRDEALGRDRDALLKTVYPIPASGVLKQLERSGSWAGEIIHITRHGRQVIVESRQELVQGISTAMLVLETNHDVTERKRAEEAMHLNLKQLEATFEGMVEPALLAGPDWNVIAINSAYLALFDFEKPPKTRDELEGDFEFANPDGSPLAPDETPLVRAMRGEVVRDVEMIGRNLRTGKSVHLLSGSAPIRNEEGDIAAVIITQHDITERIRAEQALQRSNHVLRQFAYAAAHDLQEPLRNVAVCSELLAREYAGTLDAEAKYLLETNVEGAQRMHRMVKDLLEYTKVIDGVAAAPPLTDPAGALARAQANLDQMIRDTGASFTNDPLPAVRIHEIHLIQLFQNLISNSIKYRKPHEPPRIHIGADRQLNECTFSVRDNGIGFDPANSAQIFGLFKRLHNRRDYPGTGIGLAICSRIVEHYSGRIWAESSPGNGAAFFFALPVDGRH